MLFTKFYITNWHMNDTVRKPHHDVALARCPHCANCGMFRCATLPCPGQALALSPLFCHMPQHQHEIFSTRTVFSLITANKNSWCYLPGTFPNGDIIRDSQVISVVQKELGTVDDQS